MKNKFLRMMALSLTLALFMSCLSFGAGFVDMPKNWATTALEKAVDNGLLKGSDGKIMPDNNITRAEIAAIMNRVVNAQVKADISSFTDIKGSEWCYEDIAKAISVGSFKGNGNNTIAATEYITREAAMVAVARVTGLKEGKISDISSKYHDADNVSSWAVPYVSAMINAEYIKGNDGFINPQNKMTRAEFAVMLDRVIGQYITKTGIISGTFDGSVMINTSNGGVTLKNSTINGNLYIGDGVGNGNITLDNVKVNGRLIIRGGGKNSVTAVNGSSFSEATIISPNNETRLAGDSTVICKTVNIAAPNAIIDSLKVETISLSKGSSNFTVNNSNVTKIVAESEGVSLTVDNDSVVSNVDVIVTGVTIKGDGKVETIDIKASDVKINTSGTKVTISDKVTNIIINDAPAQPGSVVETKPITPPSVGGGGSTATPNTLAGFEMIIDGSAFKGTVSGDTVTIDLSGESGSITAGKLTAKNSGNFTIGSKSIELNKEISFENMLKIVLGSDESLTKSMSVSALKAMAADKSLIPQKYRDILEASSGITLNANSIVVNGTITNESKAITIIIKLK